MKWSEIHPDLRKLYNAISTANSLDAIEKTRKAHKKAMMLLEKLTIALREKESE